MIIYQQSFHVPYFFNQTPWLLYVIVCFVWLLFDGICAFRMPVNTSKLVSYQLEIGRE